MQAVGHGNNSTRPVEETEKAFWVADLVFIEHRAHKFGASLLGISEDSKGMSPVIAVGENGGDLFDCIFRDIRAD